MKDHSKLNQKSFDFTVFVFRSIFKLPGFRLASWSALQPMRIRNTDHNYWNKNRYPQCCGSKYIESGSGSTVMLSILKEKLKTIFKKKIFSLLKYIFAQFSYWILNLYLKSYTYVSILSYFYMCRSGSVFYFRLRTRIHKSPEYGSTTLVTRPNTKLRYRF